MRYKLLQATVCLSLRACFAFGELLLREPSSGGSANLKKVRRTYYILDWANFSFANRVLAARRTAVKLYLGSKTLRSTYSGNYPSSSTNLLSDWLKLQTSPAEQEKNRTAKYHDGMNVFFLASEENGLICELVGRTVLSVGPSRGRQLNKGARRTAVASVAGAFGRGWTIDEC